MTQFKDILQMPQEPEEHSGQPMSQPRYELGTPEKSEASAALYQLPWIFITLTRNEKTIMNGNW
jgi:hypothetical protein